MHHVKISGKHKTAIFKLGFLLPHIMGSRNPFYTLTPNHHQASNVKSLNMKLERDACNSMPLYDIATKTKTIVSFLNTGSLITSL